MEPALALNNAGALITAGLGLMGLVSPSRAAAFTSIRPEGVIGVSEIRATYGGFFVALGGYALWSQNEAAFGAAGMAWLGAAAARTISVLADRSRSPKNLGGILFEAAIGTLLVLS